MDDITMPDCRRKYKGFDNESDLFERAVFDL